MYTYTSQHTVSCTATRSSTSSSASSSSNASEVGAPALSCVCSSYVHESYWYAVCYFLTALHSACRFFEWVTFFCNSYIFQYEFFPFFFVCSGSSFSQHMRDIRQWNNMRNMDGWCLYVHYLMDTDARLRETQLAWQATSITRRVCLWWFNEWSCSFYINTEHKWSNKGTCHYGITWSRVRL